jgi:hypothetical protein
MRRGFSRLQLAHWAAPKAVSTVKSSTFILVMAERADHAKKRQKIAFQDQHDVEFGLTVSSPCPNTSNVDSVACRFCIVFGKEDAGERKRKPSTNVKYFKVPFRVDHCKSHHSTVHPKKWAEYQKLHDAKSKNAFFAEKTPYISTLHAHCESDKSLNFSVDEALVDKVLVSMFAEEPEEGPDQREMNNPTAFLPTSLCKRTESGSYQVTLKKRKQFTLCRRIVGAGTSFRATARIMRDVTDVTGLGLIAAGLTDAKVSLYAKSSIAFVLQATADTVREAWAYSASFDVATCHSRSYLDIRLRVFHAGKLRNLHLLALPMFERHTGDYIFDLFTSLFDVLDPEWKGKIVGSNDGWCCKHDWRRQRSGVKNRTHCWPWLLQSMVWTSPT